MAIDFFKGDFAGELDSHHDHSCNPEEKDIPTCFEHGIGVEEVHVLGSL